MQRNTVYREYRESRHFRGTFAVCGTRYFYGEPCLKRQAANATATDKHLCLLIQYLDVANIIVNYCGDAASNSGENQRNVM
eukprot:scaffold17948_cov37-Cyclotella_meneghiniana.AAC.5